MVLEGRVAPQSGSLILKCHHVSENSVSSRGQGILQSRFALRMREALAQTTCL